MLRRRHAAAVAGQPEKRVERGRQRQLGCAACNARPAACRAGHLCDLLAVGAPQRLLQLLKVHPQGRHVARQQCLLQQLLRGARGVAAARRVVAAALLLAGRKLPGGFGALGRQVRADGGVDLSQGGALRWVWVWGLGETQGGEESRSRLGRRKRSSTLEGPGLAFTAGQLPRCCATQQEQAGRTRDGGRAARRGATSRAGSATTTSPSLSTSLSLAVPSRSTRPRCTCEDGAGKQARS